MFRHFIPGVALLTLSAGLAAAPAAPDTPQPNPAAAAALGDALKLCEKLAGVEREICVRQARENQAVTQGIGAIPGDSGVRRAAPQGEVRPGPSQH